MDNWITHAASTSGLLWRSTTCDEKFSRVRAAVRVDLTAARYGLSTLDYYLINISSDVNSGVILTIAMKMKSRLAAEPIDLLGAQAEFRQPSRNIFNTSS